jgi:hypothetical protein
MPLHIYFVYKHTCGHVCMAACMFIYIDCPLCKQKVDDPTLKVAAEFKEQVRACVVCAHTHTHTRTHTHTHR